MHDCPDCGEACDCDGEDTWVDINDECCDHSCDPDPEDDYEDDDN